MKKINYIEGSPRKDRSHSMKIAKEYLDKVKENDSGIEIKSIDPWSLDLPEFNGDMMNAKYAVIGGVDPSENEKNAWGKVTKIFDEFADADHYLFSVPMWNFNIPYKLKHYIDIVTQPGLSWSYNPDDGYKGLMSGRHLQHWCLSCWWGVDAARARQTIVAKNRSSYFYSRRSIASSCKRNWNCAKKY